MLESQYRYKRQHGALDQVWQLVSSVVYNYFCMKDIPNKIWCRCNGETKTQILTFRSTKIILCFWAAMDWSNRLISSGSVLTVVLSAKRVTHNLLLLCCFAPVEDIWAYCSFWISQKKFSSSSGISTVTYTIEIVQQIELNGRRARIEVHDKIRIWKNINKKGNFNNI